MKSLYLKLISVPLVILVLTIVTLTYMNILGIFEYKEQATKNLTKNYIKKNKEIVKLEVMKTIEEIEFSKNQATKYLKKNLKHKVEALNYSLELVYKLHNRNSDEKNIKNQLIELVKSNNSKNNSMHFFIFDINTGKFLIGTSEMTKLMKSTHNFFDKFKSKVETFDNGNGAFIEYYFEKPSQSNQKFKKIAYFKKFGPYNLIIGTSEYIDNFMPEIKSRLSDRLNKTQYDLKSYVFILEVYNMNGGKDFSKFLVMPNKPERIGKFISDDVKDIKGNYHRKEYLKGLRENGQTFVKYYYNKPNSNEVGEKLTYFYLYKPWNWIIGSGFYCDDLKEEIRKKEAILSDEINKKLLYTVVISVIAIFLSTIVQFMFTKKVSEKIADVNNSLEDKVKKQSQKIIDTNKRLETTLALSHIVSFTVNFKTMKAMHDNNLNDMFELEHDINISFEKFISMIHPDDSKRISQEFEKIFSKVEDFEINYRIITPKNNIKYIINKATVSFDENGDPQAYYISLQDVTKQELAKKRESEQSKMASMGEMIGNIAHQWRQPLAGISSILMNIDMKKMSLNRKNEEQVSEFLEYLDSKNKKISEYVQHLSKTINTFRDFLKNKKEIKSIIIQNTITNAIDIVKASLDNHFITLENNIDYDNPIEIKLNSGELEQVMINIINNSKDAILNENIKNGMIIVDLDVDKNNNKVTLSIEDNGGGIPDEIMPKIFDPYFTTKHQSNGTGLGLHMSHRIITESLGGKLWALNTKKGAKFFIELPLN